MQLSALTTNDIEAVRESRRAAGLSAVTINHDLKLLRKVLNWGVRNGYLERTPFKIGRRLKSVRTAWENACERAGLKGLQLRDLRHEAGSRFDEAGVAISYTSKLLGHTNLSTTSRYLNIHRRGLHAAMQKLEEHRASVAQALHTPAEGAQASVPSTAGADSDNLPIC